MPEYQARDFVYMETVGLVSGKSRFFIIPLSTNGERTSNVKAPETLSILWKASRGHKPSILEVNDALHLKKHELRGDSAMKGLAKESTTP